VRDMCSESSACFSLMSLSLTNQVLSAIICRGKSNLYFVVQFMMGNNEKGKSYIHN
jgi:hypothetical protein